MISPQTILIVDDKKDNLSALSTILAACTVTVVQASSSGEALKILAQSDISLTIIDVKMPEMDGFSLARLMQHHEKMSNIPIIFLTAIITDDQHVLEGYRSGAVDYIVKPIDPEILVNKVKLSLSLDNAKRALLASQDETDGQKAYFESILTAAGDGILGLDEHGTIHFANPAALQALRYTRDALVGNNISVILTDDPLKSMKFETTPFYESYEKNKILKFNETLLYKSDHTSIPVSIVCAPLAGNQQRGVSIVFSDMSVRKMLEEKLELQSRTDSVTGLSNRSMFVHSLAQSIARAKRMGKTFAMLFIDLDLFNQINDIMGHEAGDQLLKLVAQRIVHCVRLNDTVARLGGDEFTILVEDIVHESDAARVAEKIMDSFKTPFLLNNQELFVTVSIGIATFPKCGEDASALMRAADVAMYRVKSSGRNSYQFFSPEMSTDVQTKLLLEQDLRQVLDHNQLEMYYQPILAVGTNRLLGLEALLRWHRTPTEIVTPQSFISVLEETGLIVPIGRWVLWISCLQAAHWVKTGVLPPNAHMCVNISVRQFENPGFYDMVVDVLKETGLDPELLELEMTESFLMSDSPQLQNLLKKIKALGVHLAIDDFGTGYSSLSYLRRYPVDVIKIDRSFINDLTTSSKDRALVKAIVDIGHALDFKVLVEGVEKVAQLALLEKMGVDMYQGYLTTVPLPVDKCEAFITAHQAK